MADISTPVSTSTGNWTPRKGLKTFRWVPEKNGEVKATAPRAPKKDGVDQLWGGGGQKGWGGLRREGGQHHC